MSAARLLRVPAFLACFLLSASLHVANTQQIGGAEPQTLCPVKVEASIHPASLAPGNEFKVLIDLIVEPGWHVNSHHPLSENLIPTQVNFFQGELPVHLGEPLEYPSGHEVKLSFSEEPLSVYEGKVAIELFGSIEKEAKAGEGDILLSIEYQACSNTVCLAPETHELRIPLVIR